MPLQGNSQQRFGIEIPQVIPLFMHLPRQLGDLLALDGCQQGHQHIHPFQVGAGGLGVFTDPMAELGGDFQGPHGHNLFQCRVAVTAKIQRCGDQEQATKGRGGRAHKIRMPAARIIWQVRIKGNPTSAVGSSLSIESSSAIPSPSLLALPAQS